MTKNSHDECTKTIIIQIGSRFWYKTSKGRLLTAVSIAGAYHFMYSKNSGAEIAKIYNHALKKNKTVMLRVCRLTLEDINLSDLKMTNKIK